MQNADVRTSMLVSEYISVHAAVLTENVCLVSRATAPSVRMFRVPTRNLLTYLQSKLSQKQYGSAS